MTVSLTALVEAYRNRRPGDLLEADDISDDLAGEIGGVPASVVALAWWVYRNSTFALVDGRAVS